jgi:hypothetical protein
VAIKPIRIDVVYEPLMPADDTDRIRPFETEDYLFQFDEPFQSVVEELVELSVRLINLLPDPSLSPNERLERLARVVPRSQLMTAHRRTARAKLTELRRRLDELVPDPSLNHVDKLKWLVTRLDELVPGDDRAIKKLERLGDFRSTDVGVAPWGWQ